jgi:hypothetical protein
MADLLPISERLYDLSILLVFRFDDTYEHDVLLNHHIPVEEARVRAPSRARILVIRQKRAVQDELINVHSATAPLFCAKICG